jgi:hypothetical protein
MAREKQFTGNENIYAFFATSATPVRGSLKDLLAFETPKSSEPTWSAPLYAKRRSNAALLAAADVSTVTDDAPSFNNDTPFVTDDAPVVSRVLRPRKR